MNSSADLFGCRRMAL